MRCYRKFNLPIVDSLISISIITICIVSLTACQTDSVSPDIINAANDTCLLSQEEFTLEVYSSQAEKENSYYQYADFEYDRDGNLLKRTKYDWNGEVLEQEVHEYSIEGRKLRKLMLDPDGNQVQATSYFYNEQGRLVLSLTEDADQSELSRSEIEYNGNTTVRKYFRNGVLSSIRTTTRNESGHRTQEVYENLTYSNASRSSVFKNEYQGSQRTETLVYQDEEYEGRYTYEYDEAGTLRKTTYFRADPFSDQEYINFVQEYNELGHHTYTLCESCPHSDREKKYEYDELGNLIKLTTIDDDFRIYSIRTYAYQCSS